MENKEKLCISVEEAAEMLGVCRNAMYTLIHRADFPKIKVGRCYRIPRKRFEQWVEEAAGTNDI